MISNNQVQRAKLFAKLHQQNKLFILPNVWDVASAITFARQGFPALATTSAGIAYSLGYPDGEHLLFEDLLWVVRKIGQRCELPLSVDFERGYSDDPVVVKQHALQLIKAGAVGFNLEDGLSNGSLSPLDEQLAKIRALAELKKDLDLPFVINARTCVYWLKPASIVRPLDTAIERCNAFAEAGADCVFVPGALDETTAATLCKEIKAPLNLIVNPLFHDLAMMEAMGIRRLSIGSGGVRAHLHHLQQIGQELAKGEFDTLLQQPFSYARANAFFDIPSLR